MSKEKHDKIAPCYKNDQAKSLLKMWHHVGVDRVKWIKEWC